MTRRVATAVVALGLLAAPSIAHADPARQIVEGDVLRLESIQDATAMAAMAPGVPVAWDVGVSAARPDGSIAVRLEVDATPGAFSASISTCAVEWGPGGCATGASLLSDAPLVDGVIDLGEQPAAATVWYRVEVLLAAELDEQRADLVVRATGLGDEVASGGEIELPRTGLDVPGIGIWLAGVAIAAGVLLASIARRRAGREASA